MLFIAQGCSTSFSEGPNIANEKSFGPEKVLTYFDDQKAIEEQK